MKAYLVLSTLYILLLTGVGHSRELAVRSLALNGAFPLPEHYVKVDDGFQRLSFSVVQPSEVIEASAGENSLALYEQKIKSDGKFAYEIVKKVKFPSSAEGILLLGWMDGKESRYLAIDDNYLSAKYHDWLLINVTSKSVAFQFGLKNKPVVIKERSTRKYKIISPAQSGVSVIGKAKWGDKIKTFYSTFWPIRGKERGIVIFYAHRDRVAVRKITDVLLERESKTDER